MSQADSEGASTVRAPAAAAAAAAVRSPTRAPSTVARNAMPPPATSSKGTAAAAAALPSVMYRAFDVDVEQGMAAAPPAPSSTGREILWVQVVAAVGIPALDSDGKSDPFCVLTLEPVPEPIKGQPPPLRQRLETRHCSSTCEPVWGECFSFALQVGGRGRVGGTRAAAAFLCTCLSPLQNSSLPTQGSSVAISMGGGAPLASSSPTFLRARVLDYDPVRKGAGCVLRSPA